MKPFKPFWDEPKTHPLALPKDFLALFCPKIFPSYLHPTSLTSFPALSISKAHENSQA